MKKLIFLSAFLFITVVVSSQVNQSYVYQKGHNNDAIVNQTGNQNLSHIDQFGYNQGLVDQIGEKNTSDIDQGKSGSPVKNNRKPAYAGDHEWGAWVYQEGKENQATIDMQGDHGSADIFQEGDENIATQEINTFASGAYSNTRRGLDIDQTGNSNEAYQKTVKSFGCYGIKQMWIIQEGDHNFAKQFSKGGMQSKMDIEQHGDYNNNDPTNPYNVSCTGVQNPLNMPFIELPSTDITQYQNGRYSKAIIYIEGNGNNTYQWQEYTVWSTSGQNEAYIDIYGDYNDAAQGQIGESNFSDIYINGDWNVATSAQLGNNNTGWFYINGDNNCAGLEQNGNSHYSLINQIGPGNYSAVTQKH